MSMKTEKFLIVNKEIKAEITRVDNKKYHKLTVGVEILPKKRQERKEIMIKKGQILCLALVHFTLPPNSREKQSLHHLWNSL